MYLAFHVACGLSPDAGIHSRQKGALDASRRRRPIPATRVARAHIPDHVARNEDLRVSSLPFSNSLLFCIVTENIAHIVHYKVVLNATTNILTLTMSFANAMPVEP
jgi:hypothetical protein